MHFWDVLKLILGEATNVVPLFLKNPKSSAIGGILLTEADHAVSVAQTLSEQPTVAAAATAAATK